MKKVFLVVALHLFFSFANAQTPSFDWATHTGDTSGNFLVLSSVTDASGNLYTTGVVIGTVDVAPGAAIDVFTDAGFGDMLVSKTDSAGNFVWAKQVGKTSYDQGTSITLDAMGNIYVAGFFSMDSTDFDPGIGTFYLSNSGGASTFILKLDSVGNFIWAKPLGPGSNSPSSITTDASNNILVTGIFGGTVDFDPSLVDTVNLTAVSEDIYILKLNSLGNFIWVKQIDAGVTNSRSYSIATDGAENSYITGLLLGTVDVDPGTGIANLSATTAFGGEYIVKFDASGNYKWAKVINGSLSQTGGDRAIRVDNAGNCYTAGWFNNTVDFDPNAGVANLVNTISAGGATYLLKIDSLGNFKWANQIADAGNGNYRALALDAFNSIYITGTLISAGDFDPSIATDTLSTITGSTFVAKYASTGNLVWAVNFSNDTSYSDHSITLSIDCFGNIITTGVFNGTGDFNPDNTVFNLTAQSPEDIFIHKMNQTSSTGIANVQTNKNNITVYPNPFKSYATINFSEEQKNTTIKIMDVLGKEIKVIPHVHDKLVTIDKGEMKAGIYFVNIEDENKNITNKKIIIQ